MTRREQLGGKGIAQDARRMRTLLRQAGSSGKAGMPAGDHGELAGLVDDDHHQYLHLTAARTVDAAHTFTAPIYAEGGVHVGGTTDPGDDNLVVDGASTLIGQVTQNANVIRAVFTKTGINDNSATAIFTITTTNEAGDTDGGAWGCRVEGIATHNATSAIVRSAVKAFGCYFTRAKEKTGTGVHSAVTELYDGGLAETQAANKSIGDVAVTLTETSEYITTVNITLDLTGAVIGTGEFTCEAVLTWSGFLTAPVIAAS